MKLRVIHETNYDYEQLVTSSYHEIHVTPSHGASQVCLSHSLDVTPAPKAVCERVDYFQNKTSFFSLHQPHRSLSIVARSEVLLEEPRQSVLPLFGPAWEEARDAVARAGRAELLEAYEFTFASRYVPVDAGVRDFAFPSFARARSWLEAARDLTTRIHAEFVHDPTATEISTPLRDVLRNRRGVCQDFAHLQIACFRSMGLPARYVSGYLLTKPPPGRARLVGADASHAWVSAFCPNVGWVDFDPANGVMPLGQYVTVAQGRDFDDVAPISGVVVGGGRHQLRVSVDVARVE